MVRLVRIGVLLLLVALLLPAVPHSAPAEAADPAVILTTPYTSIIAGKGKEIAFPVYVVNRGTADEIVELALPSVPKDWQAFLKDKDKGYVIRSVFLTSGISQTVTFQAKPPADVPAGDYKFVVQSTTKSGNRYNLEITVGMEARALAGIRLVTFYPLLKGPSTSSFDFTIDLVNDSDDERTVGITTTQPPDWRVSLRPTGEAKEISSLRLKGGESKGLAMTVNPASKAQAGEYTIDLQAVSGEYKDAIKLQVVLLGNYEMSMTTDTGRLNAATTAGSPTSITLLLTNKGSAELKDVSLTSSQPQEWTITFKPDRIASLAPGQIQQVAVEIKPSAKALAGDYQLTFTATSGSAMSNVQIRVTVETATTWGWIGLGLVVLIILVLIGIFMRIGRR